MQQQQESCYLTTKRFAVFLLILQIKFFSNCALLLKCPLYQMHLQKIVGFRPPLEYLSERNLIFAPTNNFKDRNRRDGYTVINNFGNYGNSTNSNRPQQEEAAAPLASATCWRICNSDVNCIAYVHLLDTNECYGYSFLKRTQQYFSISSEMPLVPDAEAIFYEKTCLKVPETCKSHLWTLTKIPGNSLVFQGKKTIATLVTRRECAEMCLFEREFKCLSASFAPSFRNNRDRFNEIVATSQPRSTLGRCILSDKDKMIQPDAFRAAPYDEEYIENQCYERVIENDNCSYELYANSSFIYAEAKYVGLTQKECQSYCTHEAKFYCQGVSYHLHDVSRVSNSECLLHSEDIISMGPRSLKMRASSVYMRRVKCLDVQVLCTNDEMTIRYTPKDWFLGKMYVSQHSNNCMVQGNGTRSTLLRLQIGSELKESRCGIIRAYQMTNDYQRIFISALIVMQNNANVQTQGDRLIKVGCIMSNTSSTQNETNDFADEQEYPENVPNAIALESSLEFTQSTLPNVGSLLYNTSDAPQFLPKITLQIIDLSHNHETSDVQIGQNLELQIVGEYYQTPLSNSDLPPLPDFRATSLVAKTKDNQNYVLLIDERGCPTDETVFPALERVRTRTRNMLRARFHAFKFAGTSMVNFDLKINFCSQRCSDDNCLQYGDIGNWRAANKTVRKRRQVLNGQIIPEEQKRFKVQNPIYISTVMDVVSESAPDANNVQLEDFYIQAPPGSINNNNNSAVELPLNYKLRVRGPDMAGSKSFIYGERGVLLIASIDEQLHLDNICLNQSLLIAFFIFWLIFQIVLIFSCYYVIQKYKRLESMDAERRKIQESLEYIESRRVHWADQGGYTL